MRPIPPPNVPFFRVGVDFIGPFPATPRYRNTYVLVITDHCTRFTIAKPMKAANSRNAVAVIEENLIFRYSCPKQILLDQDSCFRNCHLFTDFL